MVVPGISDQLLVAMMIFGATLGFTSFMIVSKARLDARIRREREKAAIEGRAGK